MSRFAVLTLLGLSAATSAQEPPPVERFSAREAAQLEYDQTALGFEDWVGLNQYGGVVGRWSVAYQGTQHRRLKGAEIYHIVGREDYVESYQRKQRIRIIVGVTGGVVATAGLATLAWGLANLPTHEQKTINGVSYEYANSLGNLPWILTGVLLGTGLTAILTAAWINPHPLPPDEIRQLAIDHNRRLRKRLGLEPQGSRVRDLAVAPVFGPGQAGAQLAFRF